MGLLDRLMVEGQDGFHRGLFATRSTRDALFAQVNINVSSAFCLGNLPISVAVPGGVATLTSSLESLNAAARLVIFDERVNGDEVVFAAVASYS